MSQHRETPPDGPAANGNMTGHRATLPDGSRVLLGTRGRRRAAPDVPGLYELGFAVNRSLRYHSSRRGFFEGLHNLAMFLTTVSGSGAVVAAFAEAGWGTKAFSAIVALAAGLDGAFRFSRRARQYDSLYRRFSDLAAKIDGTENVSQADIPRWKAERRRIERDEPATMPVLDIMCRNAEYVSRGQPEKVVRFRWYQKLFAQIASLPPRSWEKVEGDDNNDSEKEKVVGKG